MSGEASIANGPVGHSEQLAAYIGSLAESMMVSRSVGGLLVNRLTELEQTAGAAITPDVYMLQVEQLLHDCEKGGSNIEGEAFDLQALHAGQNEVEYRYVMLGWARKVFGEQFGSAVSQILARSRESRE